MADDPKETSEQKEEEAIPFDASYGYELNELLSVGTAEEPEDFVEFWTNRYASALKIEQTYKVEDTGEVRNQLRVCTITYTTTGNVEIGGWLLLPVSGKIETAYVITHGYGGRDQPDFHLPLENAALLFPCCRGLPTRSLFSSIPSDANQHVLHGIKNPHQYVHGACVDDIWTGVSLLESLYPQVRSRIGYLGISFGGGIGAMALAWDDRIGKAHFNVPSFGNNTLRLTLQTFGSGASVQEQWENSPKAVAQTLSYFDAATAAKYIKAPVHCACALRDPCVAPPGQFAIYNALPVEKELFVLSAGHTEYPDIDDENAALLNELSTFFADI